MKEGSYMEKNYSATALYQANQMDIRKFLIYRGIDFISKGAYSILKTEKIIVRGNLWYNKEINRGGGAIDFIRFFYKIDRTEAINLICNYYSKNTVEDVMTPYPKSDVGQILYMFVISYEF